MFGRIAMTDLVVGRVDLRRYKAVIFGAAAFVSAFLIFSVQPIFTKIVLPVLGGTPAVWSVAMVVFQGLLLAGYLYAHLLIRFLPLRIAMAIHLAVTIIAVSVLPFAVTPDWGEPPADGHSVWLIVTFIQAIGLPFFALSANAPLLQAWLAADDRKINVYHLYAASNIGSFAALFAYPFLVEPFTNLPQQSHGWAIGFVLFIILLVSCAASSWRVEIARQKVPSVESIGWARRLSWLIFAAVPSGLLVAATASIQTDVSGGPILWLLPLAVFLLSFVFAFRDEKVGSLFWPRMVRASAIFTLTITLWDVHNFFFVLGVGLMTVLSVSMACHRALYQMRPDNGGLTEFYLFISAGGFIGGVFSALVAPHIFSWTAEYSLLTLVAALLVSIPLGATAHAMRQRALGAFLILSIMAILVIDEPGTRFNLNFTLFICVLLLFFLFRQELRPFVQGSIAATLVAIMVLPKGNDVQRSFFGVVSVKDDDAAQFRILVHGNTIHGAQRLADQGRPEPLTYYATDGAIERSLSALRTLRQGGPLNIGVVGLGIGSMACHQRDQERWMFFEIDPLVITIAQDRERFRFLSECGQSMPIILGDARLTVHKQPPHLFDYLLIDAFSSDAIPAHMVTKEAINMFMSRVSKDGLLAIHISNRYINLAPILAQIAAIRGDTLFVKATNVSSDDATQFITSSAVAVFSSGPASATVLKQAGFSPFHAPPSQRLWTDHYTNVTAEIVRTQLRRLLGT